MRCGKPENCITVQLLVIVCNEIAAKILFPQSRCETRP